jgi:hypothetical protein
MTEMLRDIFGLSKDEVWRQLSTEIGAEFVEGGFWQGDKVQARVKEWIITLDAYTVSAGRNAVTYTRMRAPFVNTDGFRFKLYRKGPLSGLGKKFGIEDVEVGFPEFDRDLIIQGNDDGKVLKLFSDSTIRRLIQSQPDIQLEVKDDEGWFGAIFPQGVDELYFQVVGTVKDVERLKSLFELFAEVLNRLCHIGSAYETDPMLTL